MNKIFKTILIFAAIVIGSSCSTKSDEVITEEAVRKEGVVAFTEAQIQRVGIEYGKVEMKNLSSTLAVNGMLDVPPQNMVSVSAMMGGFIKSIVLLQGMKITKGQVLATIQNPDFIQIQSTYLENKSKLKFLEAEYKRQEELSKENVAASKIFQQVASEYSALEAVIGAIEERLRILNINPATLTKSNIRSIVNIYAPISGYVTVINVNIGSYVTPQNVICEIVDTEHLHAELTVFEKDISKLRKGQKVRFVLVNESNKERMASIYLINHKISEDRTVRVHAHMDKENPLLMPNMYVKALIEIDNHKSTALPDEAIVNSGLKTYIFTKATTKEGKPKGEYLFKAVLITKGIAQNGFTEVILPSDFDVENSEVVTKGAYDLLSKMNNAEEE